MRIDCERSRVRLRAAVNVCVIVGLSDREERTEGKGGPREGPEEKGALDSATSRFA